GQRGVPRRDALHSLDLAGRVLFCRPHDHRGLHSFPTRRSSDLLGVQSVGPPATCSSTPPKSFLDPTFVWGFQKMGSLAHNGRFVDRKSTRLNSSHVKISYAVFCLKKKRRIGRTCIARVTARCAP